MEQFSSVEAFRYIWVNWRIMGINPFPKYKPIYYAYSVFINFNAAIVAPFTQLAQAFLVTTFAELMENLSISLEWASGCFKHCVIIVWVNTLRNSHQYLRRLDARIQLHDEELKIMERIVRNCHRFYFVYNIFFSTTLSIFIISGAVNKRMIFEAYIFWDWRASTKNYMLAYIYQCVSSGFQLILNLAVDSFAICYVYVLLGHLQTLSMRVSRIGYDRGVSLENNYMELIACIQDHTDILQYFDHIRPVVARTVLIQFIVTAFAICVATFYSIFVVSSLAVQLRTLMYLTVIFAQVLPCCYFVNDLMDVSDKLTTALYSCNWMDQSQKFRKTLIIFMQRTQKTNTIVAGSMAPVTLQTCLKIIRFSFSLFTVLTNM